MQVSLDRNNKAISRQMLNKANMIHKRNSSPPKTLTKHRNTFAQKQLKKQKLKKKNTLNPQQIISHQFMSITINDIQIINMLYILLLFHIIGCYTCPWQQQPTPNQIKQMKKEQVTQCLQEWVSKGWVDTIEAVQDQLSDEEMDSLMSMLRDDVSRLQKLEEQVILGKSVCEPVVKWAQNQTHVMVAVKLSHRWDSPPCTNTLQQTHHLQHHILQYQNICLVSHQQITFQLNLVLHNNITSYQLKKDGVGTYSITLSKETPSIWTHLDKSLIKYPIWEQIMGRNSTIKQQFEKLQEQHSTAQKVEKRQNKSDV